MLPAFLGIVYGLAAILLVLVELGQPPWTSEFLGIRFSNTINSQGARHTVWMFRSHMPWLPGPDAGNPLSPSEYLFGLRTAWLAMFALQITALVACWRRVWASPWVWAIGPAIASLVLLIYPPTSTDIYAYSSFGWVAEQGGNPYLTPPELIPGDPYAIYNDWVHITTPYGPIWTGISHAIVHLAGEDPFLTAFGFKIVATLGAFGLAIVTYFLARRFTDDPRLTTTAFVFVLWSPILITESAGPVHLDSVMMFFAVLGLLVATGTRFQSFRLGLLLVVASVLVKPATLPLVGLMALMRFTSAAPIGVIIRRVALDAVASIGLLVAGFAFYWEDGFADAAVKMARDVFIDSPMHSNPLWAWAMPHVDRAIGLTDALDVNARGAAPWFALVLALVSVGMAAWVLPRLRRSAAEHTDKENNQAVLRYLVWLWAGTTVVIGILPVNAHQWYVIWTMAPLAILLISDGHRIRQRPPNWLIGLQAWILLSFMVYHTYPK